MIGPILGGFAGLRYTSDKTNVVFHGNSLMAGVYAATPMPERTQALPPISNRLSVVNRGKPGYSWSDLSIDASNVDALFDAAKTNVLVLWEGTNTIKNNGFNGTSCYNDANSYTAARLAAHPWLIVHMTTIPCRYGSFTDADADAMNSGIATYNNLLRANWQSMGAKALVDLGQAGSPFVPPPNNTVASFNAMKISGTTIWTNQETQWVHVADNAYAAIAALVAPVLRRLKAR